MILGNVTISEVAKQNEQPPFRSGDLARLAGVSSDTLRYYERRGVLPRPARSAAGYRLYPPEALWRVRVIRRALTIGFSLAELARVFRVRESGGAPCGEVRAMAGRKLAGLEQRIGEMKSLRDDLKKLLADWDVQLARTPQGTRAHLLHGLGAASPNAEPGRKT